jgi:hypothetical protein
MNKFQFRKEADNILMNYERNPLFYKTLLDIFENEQVFKSTTLFLYLIRTGH